MLIGNESRSVDEKSRVFLPKSFQTCFPFDEDGNRHVVITAFSEECLLIYQPGAFQEAIKGLNTNPFATLQEREAATRILGASGTSPLDRQGRFKLPEKLRDQAGINDKVVLVGLVDRIEIWSAEAYERLASGPPPSLPIPPTQGVEN